MGGQDAGSGAGRAGLGERTERSAWAEATAGRGQRRVRKNFPVLRTGRLGEWIPWKGGKDGRLGA